MTTSIKEFLKITERNSDRVFIIDSINEKAYTYRDFQELSLKFSGILKINNVGQGDRIGVFLKNSIEFVVSYFACLYMGVVVVPINISLHPRNIEYIVNSTGVKMVICSPDTYPALRTIRQKGQTVRILCLVSENEKEALPEGELTLKFSELFMNHCHLVNPFSHVDENDYFTITFTSGTTARPKGIFHSIGNYVNAAQIFNKGLKVSKEDRFYHFLPMSYMAGLLNLLICPYMAGASVILGPSFNVGVGLRFWEIPRKYHVNRMWVVPSIINMLMKVDRDNEGREYCRSNIKDAFVGTAPLLPNLKEKFERRYGIPLYESYGLSELMFVASNCPGILSKEGSVGRIFEGITVRVRNESRKQFSGFQEGEIFVKTPTIMAGYLSEATLGPDPEDHEGYFATGDLGYLDNEGYLFVTDRKKDLIIKGGVNISPRAIEEILLIHPKIEQAAVVGIPHEFYGEEIAAALILKRDAILEEILPSIKQICGENLDAESLPGYICEFDKFPLNVTGKIKKNDLRKLVVEKIEGV